jgi:hypothetical protein
VKVDLGMPKELWHKPSAEITHLKTQCESLVESHEEDIEDWYFSHQSKQSLEDFLCREKVLKSAKDKSCLNEKKKKKKSKKPESKKEQKEKQDKIDKKRERINKIMDKLEL